MGRRILLVITWLSFLVAASTIVADERRPNIVLIVSDDLGYMDIGANNPQTFYETPNIDRLATQGIRFTQGYAACSVCSPTRASILTGKYPPRTGITDFIGGRRQGKLKPAPNRNHLALEEVTLAERLRDSGYLTFFAGKWHLGAGQFGPGAQGFDSDLTGPGQFFYPRSNAARPDPKDDPKSTERIASDAVAFIESHKEGPFFAYLPFLAVHIPVGARQDLVEKYEKKKATAPAEAWGQERNNRVRLVQNHVGYAAMLEQMDSAIGRVLSALDKTGAAEQTIVIFTSDNGGLSTAEGHPTSNLPQRGGKGWPYEGGVRTAWIIRAPGVRAGRTSDTPIITTDLLPTLVELAGLPPEREGPLDGVSLVPLLKGKGLERGAPLFWHYPHYSNQGGGPCGAVRDGDWKLIEWYEDGSLELYNLHDDIGEKTNLAATNPQQVKELHTKLVTWRNEVGAVMPTPNPDFQSDRAANKKAKGASKQ